MRKRTIIFGIIFIFIVGLSAYFLLIDGKIKEVCFYDRCFFVEVAETPDERAKGLQFRTSLGANKGMLFIFSSPQRQSFWMKDTLIPLDIIWMDVTKRIVFLIPHILPCATEKCPVYTPDADAKYVLEVNAGVAVEMGLSVGDQAVFR
ncbi:MAG TPA: DUF192 domain-containing protein [Candidatus Omnitrophota bacterium]|nr:DUF192 domain-containing protein [Candidatus Omnitrophota bacterium]